MVDIVGLQIMLKGLHYQVTSLQESFHALCEAVIMQTLLELFLIPLPDLCPCKLKDVEVLCERLEGELGILVFARNIIESFRGTAELYG